MPKNVKYGKMSSQTKSSYGTTAVKRGGGVQGGKKGKGQTQKGNPYQSHSGPK